MCSPPLHVRIMSTGGADSAKAKAAGLCEGDRKYPDRLAGTAAMLAGRRVMVDDPEGDGLQSGNDRDLSEARSAGAA